MQRMWNWIIGSGLCVCLLTLGIAADDTTKLSTELPAQRQIGKTEWLTDYSAAYRLAKKDHKQLLLWFRDERDLLAAAEFERDVLASPELEKKLKEFVCVSLATTSLAPATKTEVKTLDESASPGEQIAADAAAEAETVQPAKAQVSATPETPRKLLDSHAFVHMRKQPGLCIVDLVDSKDPFHGRVVTVAPLDEGKHNAASLKVVLELPRGSLSQRTLIYVLRTHPEVPHSVWGKTDAFILDQARYHSQLMANYESVGHHDWGTRSGTIGQHYGSSPMEVASVGAGGTILQAAHSAVNTWRGSGVHWGMMISQASYFGYDMIQAPSGNWYATGIIVP